MMSDANVKSRFIITKPNKHGIQDSTFIEASSKATHDFENDYQQNRDDGSINISIATDRMLALYEDDIPSKGRFHDFLQHVSSYTATIPPASDHNYNKDEEDDEDEKVTKLGTFSGVYLPCLQNIFGVILFIRLSWIVGSAGVTQAFFIVFICCCCTMLTAISMSAIATNGVVPGGGSYFMISRCLGPEFGGAVGVLFYLGTSFAASMYILGAVEIFLTYVNSNMSLFGDVHTKEGKIPTAMLNNMRVYGSMLVVLMSSVVWVGVKYVNKCAFLFLACVLVSICSIFVGFFTVHARDTPGVCLVGNHLVRSLSFEACNKNDSTLKMLYSVKEESEKYFNNSRVTFINSMPGLSSDLLKENSHSHYREVTEVIDGVRGIHGEIVSDMKTSFTILLAIFFPSVTGIMAGSNRSGNLKDAQYSIPRGTIGAILTTSIIYLLSIILFGATIQGDVLRDKFGDSTNCSMLASLVAWPNKWVILVGSLLSTIGAGLQSITGAPRLLQAIANDRLIPFLQFFSVVSNDGEPKRALVLTILIVQLGVLIASLDSVAPIITMFFLMCYGFVNFACTLQSLLKLPNWRPRFRFYHWSLSLLGVSLCLVLMFISSWYYALVAIFIAGSLYKYIEYQGAEKEWGDGLRGLSLSAARYGLLRLEGSKIHTKNWRPQLLLLCEPTFSESGVVLNEKNRKLLSIASQLKAGRGLTIVSSIVEGDFLQKTLEVDEYYEELYDAMRTEKVKGFCQVVASSNRVDALSCLIQSSGLGSMKPNTVLLSWPTSWKNDSHWQSFIHSVRVISEMHQSLVVVKNAQMFPGHAERESGFVDIWWIVHDGGMMLLMMFLLTHHKVWKKCHIRLFTVTQITDNSIQIKKDLLDLMYSLRLKAEVTVIEMDDADISAYTYERTLQAEQRREMVNRMKLTRSESRKEVQMIVDKGHRSRRSSFVEGSISLTAQNLNGMEQQKQQPEEGNVRRMNTAVKINQFVRDKSSESKLIMINLPKPPSSRERELIYMEFLEALTEGLNRVFLVRGAGHEVVTIYS